MKIHSNSLFGIAAVALVAVMVGACASQGGSKFRSKEPLDMQKNGVAFMSLGYVRRPGIIAYQTYVIGFHRQDNPDKRFVFQTKPDHESDDVKAAIQANEPIIGIAGVELPSGQYVIDSFAASMTVGVVKSVVKSNQQLNVPFTVRAGVITYLGSMLFLNSGRGGYYGHKDNLSNDSGRLLKIQPELGGVPIEAQLIGSRESGAAFPSL